MKRTALYHLILSLKGGQRSLFLHSGVYCGIKLPRELIHHCRLSNRLSLPAHFKTPLINTGRQEATHKMTCLSGVKCHPTMAKSMQSLPAAVKDVKCLQSGKKMGFVILDFGVLDEFKNWRRVFSGSLGEMLALLEKFGIEHSWWP